MRFARGGYTIIEVIIVLAISGAIFLSAVTIFAGKQARTQFSQAMQDVNSQIQSYISDVRVSLFPGAGQYTCSVSGGRPQLSPASPGDDTTGTSQDCIFLGKALFVDKTTTPGTIKSYTVLGTRLNQANSKVATSFSQSNPEAVLDDNLVEKYTLGANSTVKSSKVTDSSGVESDTNLVGFYNSLSTTSNSGSQSLAAYGYLGFPDNPGSGRLKTALEQATAGSPDPLTPITKWKVCFASGTTNQTALLTVTPSSAGVTANLEYTAC